MRFKWLSDIDRLAESLASERDPCGGYVFPAHRMVEEIGVRFRRGDFVGAWSKLVVRIWLRREERRRRVHDSQTPEALALRNTVAVERATRYSLWALTISTAALALAAWPHLPFV